MPVGPAGELTNRGAELRTEGATPPGAMKRLNAARAALRAFGRHYGCECSVVELRIDGNRFFVEFAIDREEHRRRRALGVGAASGTGLLHALWELPAGIPIPEQCLTQRDVSTLRDHGKGYVEGTDVLTRSFSPAGTIRAVVVVANQLDEAIGRLRRLPPIFRRLAVALRSPARSASASVLGGTTGIGTAVIGRGGAELLVAPAPAILGVPAVYRWWLAELAYRNWEYVNCAHCVS
ncbi:MAG: hypothetical protein QOE58_680 [Actinomycetota bacterium]|jgi:hypothetical protein|nr:hypothetical protein [Actinomycetota bacterium]